MGRADFCWWNPHGRSLRAYNDHHHSPRAPADPDADDNLRSSPDSRECAAEGVAHMPRVADASLCGSHEHTFKGEHQRNGGRKSRWIFNVDGGFENLLRGQQNRMIERIEAFSEFTVEI